MLTLPSQMRAELMLSWSIDMEIPKKIMNDFEKYCKEKNISDKKKEELIKKLSNLIKKSMYEPNEAIGIVAAQSISEPATQMSLDYNERIIIKDNNEILPVEIGKLVDINIEKFGCDVFKASEICDLPNNLNIMVPSLDQNEKIKWKKIKACIRHRSPKKLIKIKTSSGREITATPFHSFVIRKNNKIIPVSGKELRVGERIPVIKHLPANCTEYLDLGSILQTQTSVKKHLPEKMLLDNLFGWFSGAYLAEGNSTKYYVSISNTNENFISNVKEFATRYDMTCNEYDNFRGFSRGHDIRINSLLLSSLMKKMFDTGSNRKKLPDFVYNAKEDFVSGLLRGYFDGDGSISVSRKMIRVHSNSEELIDGIKLLLTRFEIFAYKHREKNQFYLIIPYKYAYIFLSKIGSNIKEKKKKLEKLSKLAKKFWDTRSLDFTDMIPNFGNIFYQIAKKLRYPTRYVNNFLKRQKIGRTTLYRYIRIFERIAKERHINIDEKLKQLKQMFNSDVVWDEITDISAIKPKTKYVYDISVDGLETFTTFDGVITHNTMRSYTMASLVSGLTKVVQGLPRMIEIFDMRKTFEKSMTIYLKEKYNSKTWAERIAKEIIETTISDVISSSVIDLVNMQIEFELEKESDVEKVKEIIKPMKIGVSYRGKKIFAKPEKTDIKNLRKLKSKILNLKIAGSSGIKKAVVTMDNNDWIIQTNGSNLKSVLENECVDMTRTTTDDIEQVSEVLGIEAARNCILREAKSTLDEQGLDVDIRHLMLVADIMTADGTVKPISRYGIAGEKPSVLARANFEETKKHLTNAALFGEVDKLKGNVENLMIGQTVPVGTGSVGLAVKRKGKEK